MVHPIPTSPFILVSKRDYMNDVMILIFFSVVIVQDKIKGFHKRFNSIKVKTIKCLKKWQIAVRTVVSLLTSIFAVTGEHKLFSETHKSLYGCEAHWELFGILHLYWNYLSCDLLDHVIEELTPKNEAISKEMAVYKEDLHKFRQHTTLEIFCQAQSKMEADLPPGFRKMVVIHNWPITATLEDVEKFRQCYSQTYNLQKCAMMLHSIGTGSFTITWFVPVTIIDILRKSRARKVYKEFKVSRLEIYYVETTAVCVYKQVCIC